MSKISITTDIFTTSSGFYIWDLAHLIAFGLASVVVVVIIGRRWFGMNSALVAAAILATLPFQVRHSQYITTDVARCVHDGATFARLPVSANPAATADNGLILLSLDVAP